MDLRLRRTLFLLILLAPYVIVSGIVISTGSEEPAGLLIRLCGLCGFIALSTGAILTILRDEIRTTLGQPFIRVHHIFVLAGLLLITLHPVLIALRFQNAAIFIPTFSSVTAFFQNGGRVAILLIYTGFLAAVFQAALKGRWLTIHRIMYPALILGIIHANFVGQDLENPVIRWLCNLMAILVIATGVMKAVQRYRRKSR